LRLADGSKSITGDLLDYHMCHRVILFKHLRAELLTKPASRTRVSVNHCLHSISLLSDRPPPNGAANADIGSLPAKAIGLVYCNNGARKGVHTDSLRVFPVHGEGFLLHCSHPERVRSATAFRKEMRDMTHTEGGMKRVLLVDDEPSVLFAFKRILEMSGTGVDTAGTRDDAEELLNKNAYDIVFSDMRLSHTDHDGGLMLARCVKETSPDTRFVLMTAYGHGDIARRASEAGADVYLEKPVSAEQIRTLVGSR